MCPSMYKLIQYNSPQTWVFLLQLLQFLHVEVGSDYLGPLLPTCLHARERAERDQHSLPLHE